MQNSWRVQIKSVKKEMGINAADTKCFNCVTSYREAGTSALYIYLIKLNLY